MIDAPYRFRLGSTSYVYPADILPNVRRLAGIVDDVELVLFEVDEQSNFPDAETIAELQQLASLHGMSYTVHLPLDLRLGTSRQEERLISIEKALKVMRATRALEPWGYIVHLYGNEPREIDTPSAWAEWRRECVQALDPLIGEVSDGPLLCVENVEGYPLEKAVPILEKLPISLCLDVGHLWLDGLDPLPYLRKYLAHTRVIHLHGIGERDHKSLALVPTEVLHAVLDELRRQDYRGVVTLEVFCQEDFFASQELVLRWARREGVA